MEKFGAGTGWVGADIKKKRRKKNYLKKYLD